MDFPCKRRLHVLNGTCCPLSFFFLFVFPSTVVFVGLTHCTVQNLFSPLGFVFFVIRCELLIRPLNPPNNSTLFASNHFFVFSNIVRYINTSHWQFSFFLFLFFFLMKPLAISLSNNFHLKINKLKNCNFSFVRVRNALSFLLQKDILYTHTHTHTRWNMHSHTFIMKMGYVIY